MHFQPSLGLVSPGLEVMNQSHHGLGTSHPNRASDESKDTDMIQMCIEILPPLPEAIIGEKYIWWMKRREDRWTHTRPVFQCPPAVAQPKDGSRPVPCCGDTSTPRPAQRGSFST